MKLEIILLIMSIANDEQDQLLKSINEFKSKTRPQNSEPKKTKRRCIK